MPTQLSLSQIKDIDNLPFYLKRLGELTIEDNNIVLNWSENETNSQSVGAGFTIQDGDGLGNDVTFSIVPLNNLPSSQNYAEYISGSGSNNRGWSTQLSDIILNNNDINNPDGQRVLKEGDIIVGGSVGSSYSVTGQREVKILIKKIDSVGYIPSTEDLSLGELAINVADGKLFALKRQDGDFVVAEFNGLNGTSGTSGFNGTSGTSGEMGTSGTSGTGFNSISNASENRILTSNNTTNAANAESNLTFDGNTLTSTSTFVVNTYTSSGLSTGSNLVATITSALNKGLIIDYYISETTGTNVARTGTIMSVHDGVLCSSTDFSSPDLNSSSSIFSWKPTVNVNGDLDIIAEITGPGVWNSRLWVRIV